MPQIDVYQQLQERFSLPLEAPQRRRIVIWHDAAGEFEDDFRQIASKGLTDVSGNAVECISIDDVSVFEAKRHITRERADASFLLYRKRNRGAVDGDWLADIELYAEHFQSDYQSMLVDEIGAQDNDDVRHTLQLFSQFFRAKDRIAKFKRAMPEAKTREDVAMGVFAVICKSEEATVESVIRAFSEALAEALDDESPDVVANLDKYEASHLFSNFIQRKIGYEGELSDARSFLCHLMLTATAAVVPPEVLGGLDRYVSSKHAEFALSVMRSWMKRVDASKTSDLYEAAEMVQEECNLVRRFQDEQPAGLIDCDIFPCIDECLLRSLMESMATGSDRCEEASALIAARKNLYWYDLTSIYYDCLSAAVKIQSFYRSHAQGFHISLAKDAWKSYTLDWWQMDAAYRDFSNAYLISKHDISSIDEASDNLAEWADALYTQWFLAESNDCWVNAAEQQWSELGYVDGVPKQRSFYAEEVYPKSGQGKRVVVGIADAMRYEVAHALSDRLQRETKGQCEVLARQSVFPSETKFGMAALLPHKTMSLTDYDGDVLVDGLPTTSTADREAVLQSFKPNSKAILFSDLIDMKSSERKEFAGDATIIYVYQNTIDKAGHAEHVGQDVFDACAQAIKDMKTLVDISCKDLGAQNVLITSDHGFLYTRQDLSEMNLSSKKQVDGEVLKAERRFLAASPGSKSDIFIDMNMGDLDGGKWTWLVARGCQRIKTSGSKNYVHGGISLQECCVPVIRFKNMKSGTKGYVGTQLASIQLLSTSRKVSNTLFNLEFFQKEAVGGKVLPAEYELVFTDSNGNEVSDTRKVLADMGSTSEQKRVTRVKFTLKAGMTWDSKATYYLVCRDKSTNKISWKEEFHIEVAFAPVEDFGW